MTQVFILIYFWVGGLWLGQTKTETDLMNCGPDAAIHCFAVSKK